VSKNNRPNSPWSFRIATIAGIPIRVHVTFLFFLALIAYIAQDSSLGTWSALVIAIFGCVLLHELGHALTAKKFGIETVDITLYPIGGVAMLGGRAKPAQELWIALAGPAVNVLIAALLLPFVLIQYGGLPPFQLRLDQVGFLEGLFIANVFLPLFNMIPAFPMDGGRVLRALLALRMPEERATQIAASIGQVLAIGLGIAGFSFKNMFLILISVFVFFGAGQEVAVAQGLALVANKTVRDAMMTHFRTLGTGETLSAASKALLEGAQQDFPVVYGTEVIGLLTREDIIRGLASDGPNAYIAAHMRRDFKKLPPHAKLEDALTLFTTHDRSPILVMEDDRLEGLLTVENLSEFMMIRQVKARNDLTN
jgi:Zn-dependent protease